MSPDAVVIEAPTSGSEISDEPWEIPPSWTWGPLGDIADLLDHRRVPINSKQRAARCDGKATSELFPYYGATGQVGWIDGFLFEGDHILLGEDGAPFLDRTKSKAYLASGRYWVNNHAHILEMKPGIELRWLLHALNWANYEEFVGGTTRLKLTQADLVKIPIPIAPLSEQRRIVARIDELFAEITEGEAALERARQGLDTWRRALLKAAVTGELTRDWRAANRPTETGADLLARIRAQLGGLEAETIPARRPDMHEPPAFFEEPEGWEWTRIGDLTEVIDYGTSDKCTTDSVGVPVLRMGNIQDGNLDISRLKYADPTQVKNLPLLERGDVLFNRTNSAELVGKSAIYRGFPDPCSFASYLIRVRVALCEPDFVAYWLNSVFGKSWVANNKSQQVGQANLSGGKLKRMPVPLPPLLEQKEIVRRVQEQFDVGDTGALTIGRVDRDRAALRQAILKAAFEGRLVPQNPADEPASALLARVRNGHPEVGARRRRGRAAVDFFHPSLPGLTPQYVDPRVEPAGDE